MTTRADLVIHGQVIVEARADGFILADAVAVADGRVLATGTRDEVDATAARGARVIDAGDAVVIPGLHDFHIHLVGLARSRREVLLDDARDGNEVLERLHTAALALDSSAWLLGRGWTESQLGGLDPSALERAVGGRPAFMKSHDGHSAWASLDARTRAGIRDSTDDPPGGRIERAGDGSPSGILRETALDLVAPVAHRLQGSTLRAPLDETLREMSAMGLTGASEAGDYTDANGTGADAAFGDSYSSLTDLADLLDGRLRMNLGIPVDALDAAAERGLRTGEVLRGTLRFGWAKEYSDGALGSGTAALLDERSCDEGGTGILRVDAEELDDLFRRARRARIGLAIHAIGDRAVLAVLDALERAPARSGATPKDRMEHVQLLAPGTAHRFVPMGLTASIQPIHAASDRDLVEACWDGRQERAYAWRDLVGHGALLAAGSDAPVESVDPWAGMFAAVHRRFPTDQRDDWRPSQALSIEEALRAYTVGPALALGADDEGQLRPGARADLAVLSCDLDTLRAADERLAGVRSVLTLVAGSEVPLG